MTNIAIENDHRNSGFSHWKWWLSIVMWQFTRGYVQLLGLDERVETDPSVPLNKLWSGRSVTFRSQRFTSQPSSTSEQWTGQVWMYMYLPVCQKMIFWKIARWTRTPKSLGLSSPSKCLTLGYPWISTIFRQTQNNCHIYIHTPFYIPILLISSWLDIPSFSHKITVISPYSWPNQPQVGPSAWPKSESLFILHRLQRAPGFFGMFRMPFSPDCMVPKHICIHMYTLCVCVYVCMYVCMDGWMDGWMDGRMYVCMYVCICMYVRTYVCIHIYIFK